LKKALVDKDKLVITQDALEEELFAILREQHYGQSTIDLYNKVSLLHHRKIPMVLLVTGPPGIGKSQVAARLADRLNLTCILRTEIVLELLSCICERYSSTSGILDAAISFADWMNCFSRECSQTLDAMKGDIIKYIKEGKSFIIEGIHVTDELVRFIQETIHSMCRTGQTAIIAFYRLTVGNQGVLKERLADRIDALPTANTMGTVERTHEKVVALQRWYEDHLSSDFVPIAVEDHLIQHAVQLIHDHFLKLIHNYDPSPN
jgi:2-phosphoglycerate kinase